MYLLPQSALLSKMEKYLLVAQCAIISVKALNTNKTNHCKDQCNNSLTFLFSKNPCLMIALPSMNLWKLLLLACSSSITRRWALLYLVQQEY